MAGDVIRVRVCIAMKSVAESTVTAAAEIPAADWAAMDRAQRLSCLDQIATEARDREVVAWAVLDDGLDGEGGAWPAGADRHHVGIAGQ